MTEATAAATAINNQTCMPWFLRAAARKLIIVRRMHYLPQCHLIIRLIEQQ
jgi:hypothetical protein